MLMYLSVSLSASLAAAALLTAPAACAQTAATNTPPTQARLLCEAYENCRSVACEIRKTSSHGTNTVTLLSRIFYQRPDRIHVENFAPMHRRIVADGATLFYHEDGVPRGFSRPIGQLDTTWLASLRNVPGTPHDHLVHLRSTPEQALPPTAEHPVRVGYNTGKVFVVLALDTQRRPVRIEFFADATLQSRKAVYDYSRFQQAGNCWFPCLHKGLVFLPEGNTITETRWISNLQVDQPIAPGLFDPAAFFKEVEFVADFKATYATDKP
jgi:hypothetical protein